MINLKLCNVDGWKTLVDPSGKMVHEKIGVGDLVFSNDHLKFADLIIPYQKVEEPKLHLDRALFRHWIRFDVICSDTQYSFGMRAKLNQLECIPLPFKISINRRIVMNLVFAYIGFQLIIFLSWLIKIWLLH